MHRRPVLGALAASTLVSAPFVSRAQRGQLAFRAQRNGRDIGRHSMAFERVNEELVVDIKIDLQVKLLFVTVYTYAHTNRERWRNGIFQGFASDTDDNGDLFQVNARYTGDAIVAETSTERFEHPPQRRPTTYWHKSFLENTKWIDTQQGRMVDCRMVTNEQRTIEILGQSIDTDYFKLEGDLALELWYQGNDWVRLRFEGEDGSVIDYILEEFSPIDMSFA